MWLLANYIIRITYILQSPFRTRRPSGALQECSAASDHLPQSIFDDPNLKKDSSRKESFLVTGSVLLEDSERPGEILLILEKNICGSGALSFCSHGLTSTHLLRPINIVLIDYYTNSCSYYLFCLFLFS